MSREASLVTIDPDGTHERVFLANPPEGGRLAVDWSPDGLWTVMSAADRSGHSPPHDAMYLTRVEGGQVFFIGSGFEPDWRPESP